MMYFSHIEFLNAIFGELDIHYLDIEDAVSGSESAQESFGVFLVYHDVAVLRDVAHHCFVGKLFFK